MIKICKYFLFLGSTGFGGPLSLIQQMRQHFVVHEKSLTAEHFDQAFTLIKAMPGPIAFQMAVYCSQHLHGRLAGFLAGISLLLPAFVLMIMAAISHEFLVGNSYVTQLLNGFQFAVAAIILLGLKTFFKQYYKMLTFWFVSATAAYLYFTRMVPEPLIIVGFGLTCVAIASVKQNSSASFSVAFFAFDSEVLWNVFRVCTYAGAIVFGTGLAMLPVLQEQFVVNYHWLDLQTFNDGVTFGQMTPGPVTITATFLGYKIAGFAGALVATIGIFLLPLFHMLTWFPRVQDWLKKQFWIGNFLLGATSAVVGVLLVTVFRMNQSFVGNLNFWIIFLATFFVALAFQKIPIYILIFAGGLINLLIGFATMNSI